METTGTSVSRGSAVGDRRAQAVAGRRHERRVEGARDLQRHDLLGAQLLGVGGGRGDAVRRAGDDDLAGGVVVGDPHVGVGAAAGDVDLVVVEAEHGGHRARLGEPGLVHGVGPGDDEADAVVEAERAGGRQRGVLAEAVPGAEARLDAEALDGVEDHQAGDERGQLGVAGVPQLVGVGVEEQGGDVAPGDLAGLLDQLPALVVDPRPTHAGSLRALAREREREHRRKARRHGWPAESLPAGSSAVDGAPGGTRTHTVRILRPLPLPIGLPGRLGRDSVTGPGAVSSAASRQMQNSLPAGSTSTQDQSPAEGRCSTADARPERRRRTGSAGCGSACGTSQPDPHSAAEHRGSCSWRGTVRAWCETSHQGRRRAAGVRRARVTPRGAR